MNRRPPPPARPDWAYFLDLDGTLLELAERPEDVRADGPLLDLLERLRVCCGGALALVSGRSLVDLDRCLGRDGLPGAGLHGYERRGDDGRVRRGPAAFNQEMLAGWLDGRLAALARRHPGLVVEDKGAALALHYRLAPRLGPWLHRLARQLAREAGPGTVLRRGKRVVEIGPAGHDKGSAVLDFMTRPPFRGRRPVFVGDDLTDEAGFAMAEALGGLSVKVGPGPSVARHRLADVAAVRAWLGEV